MFTFPSTPEVLPLFNASFLARLTSVQAGSGGQAGLWIYGFTEQAFDVSTGIPADASTPRTDNLSTAGTTYALENENVFLNVPGVTPAGYGNPGPYVEMRLRGIVDGSPIYEFSHCCPGTTTTTTTTTTTVAPCSGSCRFTWSGPSTTWSPVSGQSVCSSGCNCLQPQYCGTADGDCTQTGCSSAPIVPTPDCSGSTTTAGPTTTPSPMCSTTASPTCTTCQWFWNGVGFSLLYNNCTSGCCSCPPPPANATPAPGSNPGCYFLPPTPCQAAPPPPQPNCGGNCQWLAVQPNPDDPSTLQWLIKHNGCNYCWPELINCTWNCFGTPPCACGCEQPSYPPGACGNTEQTPCQWQCPVTTTPCPCPNFNCYNPTTTVAPSCGGQCYFRWSGSQWSQLSNGCFGTSGDCVCVVPPYNGQDTCQVQSTFCQPSGTTTTTAGPTTTTTAAPCGTCTYPVSGGSWSAVINNCTSSSCGCPNPPTPQPDPGVTSALVQCTPTTTTVAPCGLCTYSASPPPWDPASPPIYILTGNTCTGACACCGIFGTPASGAPTTIQVPCGTLPCTTTTPAPGDCVWAYLAGGNFTLAGGSCSGGNQCSAPPHNACSDCYGVIYTPCVSTTTTTTSPACTSGSCAFICNPPNWVQQGGGSCAGCACDESGLGSCTSANRGQIKSTGCTPTTTTTTTTAAPSCNVYSDPGPYSLIANGSPASESSSVVSGTGNWSISGIWKFTGGTLPEIQLIGNLPMTGNQIISEVNAFTGLWKFIANDFGFGTTLIASMSLSLPAGENITATINHTGTGTWSTTFSSTSLGTVTLSGSYSFHVAETIDQGTWGTNVSGHSTATSTLTDLCISD